MCFYISKNVEHQEPLLAKEDVVCYKVLKKGDTIKSITPKHKDGRYLLEWVKRIFDTPVLYSPIQHHVYNVGVVQPKKVLVGEGGEIHVGYHSYISTDISISSWGSLNLFNNKDMGLYKCIIPKGSYYYMNMEHGEYVSESIMLVSDTPDFIVPKDS